MKSATENSFMRPAIVARAGWLALALCLLVSTPAAAVEGTPCTPEPTDMTITYGDLINCSIGMVGDADIFRFSGVTGEAVSLHAAKLSGPGFPCINLFRPDGTPVFGGCVTFPFTQPLNQTGTWAVTVEDQVNDQTVDYALALERVAPPSPNARPIAYAETLGDEINGIGDIDLFSFEGVAGSAVRIQAARLSGMGFPCIALFRPNGTPFFGGCITVPFTPTLDQTGTHTIRVEDQGNNQTVAYNVTLQCVSGPCPTPVQHDAPVDCFSTTASGSGETFIKVCFSNRGNLVQFESPQGAEHLRVKAHGEGYAVCSATGSHGFDAGYVDTGFGPPTITQPNGPNTFPLTIVRETLDGVFRLTQKFARDAAEKDVTITMTVKNISASPVSGVQLSRYFDGDIDGSVGGDRYAKSQDSVWGWEDTSGNGLILTALATNLSHTTGIESFTNWDRQFGGGAAASCGPGGATPSMVGDYVGRLNYSLGTLSPNASRSVKVTYRRF